MGLNKFTSETADISMVEDELHPSSFGIICILNYFLQAKQLAVRFGLQRGHLTQTLVCEL